MKKIFAIVILLGSPFCGRLFGQERDSQKIIFHVTAAHSQEATDVCTRETNCNATRFTVEGYSNTNGESIEYVLDCVEIMAFDPSPHFLVACDHVHAHKDYAARLMTNAIAFGETKPRSPNGTGLSAYRILSEKEITK